MPDPIIVQCPKDVWTPVAINVISGVIKIIDSLPSFYLETYRITGSQAPIGTEDGSQMSKYEHINSSYRIDVYVRAVGNDGRVRVDL